MTLVQDNSVQAINTALLSIKRDISALTATTAGTTAGLEPGKTYNINISGNAETATTAKAARTATNANHAETAETATKMSNALTVNGKTYDGSSAVNAGVQTVANGGTGVTTQADINKAFISNLDVGESDVTDGTEFVSSYASDSGFSSTDEGSLHTPYKRQFVKVWNYIKGKIASVLGLTATNYGGTAAAILDYVKGTPIKVRWSGPGINSAEWYPAFNADGSALEPINRANIHAGTAYKVSNALTVNGKTYDGSSAVDVGVQTVANGGTGATDAASGFNTLADGVRDSSTPEDGEKMLLKPAGTWYKTTCLDFWNYIKGKISSVLGLAESKLTIQGNTVGSNSYTDTNPKLEFKNADGSQNLSLTFTDFDAVQAPASLTLNGNQGNEYFIAPCIKANNKMRIPIGAPSSLEDGCIWIER